MIYTRKGDNGETSAFGCNQKFSKNSVLIEALGSVDEINSLLGICKIKSGDFKVKVKEGEILFERIIEDIQQNLFIIQANIAGSDKKITQNKISQIEEIIGEIEKQLPPIKSFFISGGTEFSSLIDYARTIARRAERRAVAYSEEKKLDDEILAYLNRLSSLLYALSRFINFKSGAKEDSPKYENS